jgi:hypothetical protein
LEVISFSVGTEVYLSIVTLDLLTAGAPEPLTGLAFIVFALFSVA